MVSFKTLPAVLLLFVSFLCQAQTPTATISGRVVDPSGAVIQNAIINAINVDTNVRHSTETNSVGQFTIPNLLPSTYKVEISKPGFRTLVRPDIVVHVQDILALNFIMPVGASSEIVTVEAGAPMVNTEDASVSTVIDRNFAENLPMNGRSFQTLIQLTPGVVLTTNNNLDTGQFSVNGQRATSNYWMVDGVSANTGISAFFTPGNGLGGTLGTSSAFGGTNSLVSVDALQEFRIQTSTFAPEFGRTPGAQISIATRFGTNDFHGSLFDYLRNDLLDANNWFNGFTNTTPLPKPEERQNDFGGTIGGPILRNRTFFFLSYEGFRLRLPQTALTNVPDVGARQNATAAMKAFLNAYPVPNGADNTSTAVAQFNSSFSNPGTLDAYSLRIDHRLTDRLNVFGRYNYAPSRIDQRGFQGTSLSTIAPTAINSQSTTVGAVWMFSSTAVNDFRFNFSTTKASSRFQLDNFGGATPLTSLPLPSSLSTEDAEFNFLVSSLGSANLLVSGKVTNNEQRQINVVDSLSLHHGSHDFKFGIDFRRLSPDFHPRIYQQEPVFLTVAAAEAGTPFFTFQYASRDATLLFRDLGLYGQDMWRVAPRLSLTYGLRWDFEPSPSALDGPDFVAVSGFDLRNLGNLALAGAGEAVYKTRHDNFAPRVGLTYELSRKPDWQTAVRGGFGLFYDLASSEAGNIARGTFYPFGTFGLTLGGGFPLTAPAPPAITPPGGGTGSVLAFDPNLKLPYTLQWNVTAEQGLAKLQSISLSYIGSVGRRLIQTADISKPNPNYASADIVTNAATSDYDALQLQFRRRLSHGLQALSSYTWAHSIDTASAGSIGSGSNTLTALDPTVNRGSSDFDVRHSVSIGLTYDVPPLTLAPLERMLLGGWSTENIFQARSASPVNVFYDPTSFAGSISGFTTQVRPNLVVGQPFYLMGSQYPGGKRLNSAAFSAPPLNSSNVPISQGDVARNSLRGFGASQWDFAAHRTFPIHEAIKLQFRAELFNVLNHPTFAQPVANLGKPAIGSNRAVSNPQFGLATQTLNQGLGGSIGTGGLIPLYQIGGPRSIQFALKILF